METSTEIVDFQATHAASVALIGTLIIKHGCITSSLARSKGDLGLYVEASREAHQILHTLGHRIVPRSEVLIGNMPGFLQVAGLRSLLGSKFGQVGVGWHCSQAPDEITHLARELEEMVVRSGLPAPAIRKLLGTGA